MPQLELFVKIETPANRPTIISFAHGPLEIPACDRALAWRAISAPCVGLEMIGKFPAISKRGLTPQPSSDKITTWCRRKDTPITPCVSESSHFN